MNRFILLIFSYCLLGLTPGLHAAKKLDAAHAEKNAANTHTKIPRQKLTVMTFNVENLFDTKDDPNKSDETYIPLKEKQSSAHKERCRKYDKYKWREECLYADWNEETLNVKLKRLGSVIKAVGNGKGPDVILFQEIENRDILERLRLEQLDSIGLKYTVLIDGRDKRGIDVGMISRYELAGEPVLHQIPFKDMNERQLEDTRGILEAGFKLESGEVVKFFAVHFPAPFHPVEFRKQGYAYLNELLAKLPQEQLALAGGDFNTPGDEDQRERILKNSVRPNWSIAHDLCKGCKGTTFYPPQKSWSYLDMILVRIPKNGPAAGNSWKIEKVWLNNKHPEQKQKDGTPKRFDMDEKTGVSDHWPLVVEMVR